jgi:hypothetical protein
MVEVVIAKYKEDISWTKLFKRSKLFIYDKSGDDNGYINLPNFGREAHTYLYHIVNNYDNLSDYVCFLQGNPYDGVKGNLSQNIETIDSYNGSDFLCLSHLLKCNLDGGPVHPGLNIKEIIFDKYFENSPNELYFIVGAQFLVSRNFIKMRPKQFYINLLSEFDRDDINDTVIPPHKGGGVNKMPWIMERIWFYVFNEKYKLKL